VRKSVSGFKLSPQLCATSCAALAFEKRKRPERTQRRWRRALNAPAASTAASSARFCKRLGGTHESYAPRRVHEREEKHKARFDAPFGFVPQESAECAEAQDLADERAGKDDENAELEAPDGARRYRGRRMAGERRKLDSDEDGDGREP